MAIQIIEENRRPAPPKKPTLKDRFLNAMDVAVDVGSNTWLSESEKKAAKEKQEKENEFARRRFGEDISGLTDPKARQEYFSERFRGQTQEKKAQFDAFTQGSRDRKKFENERTLQREKYGFESQKQGNKLTQQEIFSRAMNGQNITQEELSSLPINVQLQLSEKQGEDDFLSKLMGGERSQGINDISHQFSEEELDESPQQSSKFNYNEPKTWNDKQINTLRSMESKSSKAKTLKNLAQIEYDRRQESKKSQTKYRENIVPLQSALETLDDMDRLGKKGNLGIGTKVRGIWSPQSRRDSAEYERLGKSLIQYSTNIPIRNKLEFETLAHDLFDPSISDASREGIISAMRKIIKNSMSQYEEPEEIDIGVVKVPSEPGVKRPSNKDRPSLTSFFR